MINTADYVDDLVSGWIAQGKDKTFIVWNTALSCVGWPYVFGSWGSYCTPAERRKRYREDHQTIKSACKNYDGTHGCNGCKWYPNDDCVRCFDCRGFTDWCLSRVGFDLKGEGATSQWNTADNWEVKGTIDQMPADTLCCLFVKNGSSMSHTGLGYNMETIECSAGVQHKSTRAKGWTHYAVPKGFPVGDRPVPVQKPTIRRGSTGKYVVECQTDLAQLGYNIGSTCADGRFGLQTEKAVIEFQGDHGLKTDGIVGPATWAALDAAVGPTPEPTPVHLYTVTIEHCTDDQARKLCNDYPSAMVTEEGG